MAILRSLPGLLLIAFTSSAVLADDPATGTVADSVESVTQDGSLPPLTSDEGDTGIVDNSDGYGGDDPALDEGVVDEGGTVDDGTIDDGTIDDGYTDGGDVDDGTVDDGTVDDDYVDDGTVDDGSVDDGTNGDGTVDDDYVDEGTVDDGSVDDGTVDDGTVDDGSSDDGTTDEGEADEEYADDGSIDDGTVDEGGTVDPDVIQIGDGGDVIKLEDGTIVLRDPTAGGFGGGIYDIYTTTVMRGGDSLPPGSVPIDSFVTADADTQPPVNVEIESPMAGAGADSSAPAPAVSLDLTDAVGAAPYAATEAGTLLGASEPIVTVGDTADTAATGAAPAKTASGSARIRDGHLVEVPN